MDDSEDLEKVDVRAEQGDSAKKRPGLAQSSNTYPFVWRGQRKPYEAYKIKAKAPRLVIWYGTGGGAFNRTSFAYHDLLKVNGNEAGTELEFICRYEIIQICGKNMEAIIDAIDSHACGLLQEFHHLRFEKPDPTAPIIEEIRFPSEEDQV